MYKRLVANRIIIFIVCAIIYFALDILVRLSGALNFYSFLGLKNFLPITLGLLFGIYGILGAFVGCTLTSLIICTHINFLIMEYICILIPGFIAWFFWHIKSKTHKVHFKLRVNFIKYFLIVFISYFICGMISRVLINEFAFLDLMIWHVSLSILIGIPVDIMYSGLMCLNPILPPIKENGKFITIKDDIIANLTSDVTTFAVLSEKIEEFAMTNKIEMKRLFEIQSCVEEFYLRIIRVVPDAIIDFRANYDITFSVEYNYIGEKNNPLYVDKGEEDADIAGLKLIKHRALLATYSYLYGENNIHVVI